jgi:hypothetical protein
VCTGIAWNSNIKIEAAKLTISIESRNVEPMNDC